MKSSEEYAALAEEYAEQTGSNTTKSIVYANLAIAAAFMEFGQEPELPKYPGVISYTRVKAFQQDMQDQGIFLCPDPPCVLRADHSPSHHAPWPAKAPTRCKFTTNEGWRCVLTQNLHNEEHLVDDRELVDQMGL